MREHVEIVPATTGRRATVEDGGSDLAVARAEAAVAAGRPLRGNERREIRHDVLSRQAPAGQSQRRRPTVDEWLERISPEERANIEHSERFAKMSEVARAHVLRRRDAFEEIEEQAEYLAAFQTEEAWLAAQGDDEPEPEWAPEWTPGLNPAEARALEHETSLADPWGSAQASLAAETAGPLYNGPEDAVWSDDLEDGYVDDDLGGEAA